MKQLFRKIFAPLLKVFESGTGEFSYRKSHRTALIAVGALFWVISTISGIAASAMTEAATWIPVIVFFLGGMVCLVLGLLGNDRAVATIWGSK